MKNRLKKLYRKIFPKEITYKNTPSRDFVKEKLMRIIIRYPLYEIILSAPKYNKLLKYVDNHLSRKIRLSNASLKMKLYCFLNDLNEIPLCRNCYSYTHISNLNRMSKFNDFCSSLCRHEYDRRMNVVNKLHLR